MLNECKEQFLKLFEAWESASSRQERDFIAAELTRVFQTWSSEFWYQVWHMSETDIQTNHNDLVNAGMKLFDLVKPRPRQEQG